MNQPSQHNSDEQKKRQLKKHKAMATGLFLLMAVVYILCVWYQKTAPFAWVGYVKAFSEAAMVGALADWFAVTALFHHPLGIPIPHTNLIENRKKSIGDNLGGFVVANFLNSGTIRPYIQKLQVSSYVANWLEKEKNIHILVDEISRLIRDIIDKIDDTAVTKFLSYKSKDILNDIKLNEVVAGGLNAIAERGDHNRIMDYVLKKVKDYIIGNEDLVRKRVKEESYFLIPGFVDNIIAAKITKGTARYIDEIENDPQHKLRQDFDQQLKLFIDDVKTNPDWQEELQGIKDSLLTGDRVKQYANAAWKSFRESVMNDLSGERSAVKLYMKKTLREMVQNLQKDEALRNKIDKWVQFNSYRYTLKNADKVGELISNTVGDWEGKELSNKLELEVGKDLQFIRINGTLVGGLVGLLIHLITNFLG